MDNWAVEGTKCAEKCSWSEAQPQAEIIIDTVVVDVIKLLCKEIKDEWQMLLLGKVEDGVAYVLDYYIPKQRVTAGSVTHDDAITRAFIDENKVVATIHSHANMKTFFSQTDVKDTNMSLIDYHVVVNNDLDTTGGRKITLPCGMVGIANIKVTLVTDEKKIVVKGMENIKKTTYSTAWADGYEHYHKQPDVLSGFRLMHTQKYQSADDADELGDMLLREGTFHAC